MGSFLEKPMTTSTLPAPTGLITTDGEGHGNVYAREPKMEYAAADAGWDFMSAPKSSTAGSPWLALLPHSPQNSSPAKAYCTPLASRGHATHARTLLMEDAMTKAIDPSATSNANQQHNTKRRLTTLGLVAKQ